MTSLATSSRLHRTCGTLCRDSHGILHYIEVTKTGPFGIQSWITRPRFDGRSPPMTYRMSDGDFTLSVSAFCLHGLPICGLSGNHQMKIFMHYFGTFSNTSSQYCDLRLIPLYSSQLLAAPFSTWGGEVVTRNKHYSGFNCCFKSEPGLYINVLHPIQVDAQWLPLDEPVASKAVFIIVSGLDGGRKRF